MNSRLQSKLEKLECHAVSVIELIRECGVEIEQMRAWVQPLVESYLAATRYCGLPISADAREQIEMDSIEEVLLTLRELGNKRVTQESLIDAVTRARILLCRERYGYEPTVEELEVDDRLTERVREDMLAGIPVEQSEAARLIRESTFRPRVEKQIDSMRAYLAGSTCPLN